MDPNIRITTVIALLLRAFLDDVDRPWYGVELMATTGLPSGTVYPALARLERAGWLRSAKEKIDPRVEGRPRRRYFTLDRRAVATARHEVATLAQRLHIESAPAPESRRRPGFAGGAA